MISFARWGVTIASGVDGSKRWDDLVADFAGLSAGLADVPERDQVTQGGVAFFGGAAES
jgi:hypothetical protein